jgi:hypothetical protein
LKKNDLGKEIVVLSKGKISGLSLLSVMLKDPFLLTAAVIDVTHHNLLIIIK